MSSKKPEPKHLGRGLESLLGPINFEKTAAEAQLSSTPTTADTEQLPKDPNIASALRQIPLEQIETNPYQPRTNWDQAELEDLADSIKANGLIQPIIVRKNTSGYELIAGERRFRASKMAGQKTISAMIRDATDEQMLELALVENIHRANLNPIERAAAYKKYLDSFNISQTEAAQRLGEDRSVVSNYLRLLDLPKEIRAMLIEGSLSMGHARAILGLPNDDLRKKLANRAMAGRLSVREVEAIVRKQLTTAVGEPKKEKPDKPLHILHLENRLREELGTKVIIKTKKDGKKGKIEIDFYSLDEFDRIASKMGIGLTEE